MPVMCNGCRENRVSVTRQVRIYSRSRQYQMRFKLCETCWGGMFDLMKASADGWTEGLWSPIQSVTGPETQGSPGHLRPDVR